MADATAVLRHEGRRLSDLAQVLLRTTRRGPARSVASAGDLASEVFCAASLARNGCDKRLCHVTYADESAAVGVPREFSSQNLILGSARRHALYEESRAQSPLQGVLRANFTGLCSIFRPPWFYVGGIRRMCSGVVRHAIYRVLCGAILWWRTTTSCASHPTSRSRKNRELVCTKHTSKQLQRYRPFQLPRDRTLSLLMCAHRIFRATVADSGDTLPRPEGLSHALRLLWVSLMVEQFFN